MNTQTDTPKLDGMVQLWGWQCDKCSHQWLPRSTKQQPKYCPKCKNPNWFLPKDKNFIKDKTCQNLTF